jgi:trigger factor
LGSQFKAVADLEKSVREGLTMEKTEKENEKLRIKALAEIAKDSKMDVPEILIERTLAGMMQDYERFMPKDGDSKKQEKFLEELKAKTRERAEESVKGNLVMYALSLQEKLAPTAQEIEAEAAHHNVDAEKEHEYLYSALQNKKVFEYLESFAVKA